MSLTRRAFGTAVGATAATAAVGIPAVATPASAATPARGERALRRGDWKYYRGKGGTDQLFQLAHDQREQADRAQAEPKLLAELRASWERTDAGLLPYSTGS